MKVVAKVELPMHLKNFIVSDTTDFIASDLPAQQVGTHDTKNLPRCPTCQSADIEKISLSSKAGKVALVGVFAISRVGKSFKCNNCTYQW